MNARFWTYEHGSPVKITLRPGQVLHHASYSPTDEGWSSSWDRWEYDGETVWRQSGTDGVDCDGRLSTHCETFCHISQLAFIEPEYEEIKYPNWSRISSGQRDYSAEAMGY